MGSEMCIRDRLKIFRQDLGLDLPVLASMTLQSSVFLPQLQMCSRTTRDHCPRRVCDRCRKETNQRRAFTGHVTFASASVATRRVMSFAGISVWGEVLGSNNCVRQTHEGSSWILNFGLFLKRLCDLSRSSKLRQRRFFERKSLAIRTGLSARHLPP